MVAICVQIFCVPLQQSFAQSPRDIVSGDILDSDAFFRNVSQRPKFGEYSAQIEALLKKMTLEEKVGQMTQLEIGTVTSGSDQTIAIDPAKLEKAVVQYKAGSILNVNGQALSVEKWRDIIGAISKLCSKDPA